MKTLRKKHICLFGLGALALAGMACGQHGDVGPDWNVAEINQDGGPQGWKQVSVASNYACGLTTDGEVNCWGNSNTPSENPPQEEFQEISVGANHACGLEINGQVHCWGWEGALPPQGQMLQLSTGRHHSCAVKADNTVICWGGNAYGATDVPEDRFKQVSAGAEYTCGITLGDEVKCWGLDDDPGMDLDFGQARPPRGKFKKVSAGKSTTCAITMDDGLRCWGRMRTNHVPGIIAVDVTTYHICGIELTGEVACWGYGSEPGEGDGQAIPPDGTFRQVSVRNATSCGITTGNEIECWGKVFEGQP